MKKSCIETTTENWQRDRHQWARTWQTVAASGSQHECSLHHRKETTSRNLLCISLH